MYVYWKCAHGKHMLKINELEFFFCQNLSTFYIFLKNEICFFTIHNSTAYVYSSRLHLMTSFIDLTECNSVHEEITQWPTGLLFSEELHCLLSAAIRLRVWESKQSRNQNFSDQWSFTKKRSTIILVIKGASQKLRL